MLMEPVTGTVTLRELTDAKSVRALALAAEGRPLGEALRGVRSQNGWTLKLGEPATPWWLLDVERWSAMLFGLDASNSTWLDV